MEDRERIAAMFRMIPEGWDQRPMLIAHEIREFLKQLVDEGSYIDSGGGDGLADLHPVIGGTEFHIRITAPRR